jgi:hypothetical protein
MRKATTALGGTAIAIAALEAFRRYRRWHMRWGASDEEVWREMPGDELVPHSHFTPTRAITIDAPPEAVWPWLVQLGYGRGGWYSYDLLDNLGHGRSAEEIRPELQGLHVGDWVPMGPIVNEETAFVVDRIDPPHSMLWVKPASTWVWQLEELPGGRTRLVTRIRMHYAIGLSVIPALFLAELGDFWMMRKELRSIRERAERHTVAAAIAV